MAKFWFGILMVIVGTMIYFLADDPSAQPVSTLFVFTGLLCAFVGGLDLAARVLNDVADAQMLRNVSTAPAKASPEQQAGGQAQPQAPPSSPPQPSSQARTEDLVRQLAGRDDITALDDANGNLVLMTSVKLGKQK